MSDTLVIPKLLHEASTTCFEGGSSTANIPSRYLMPVIGGGFLGKKKMGEIKPFKITLRDKDKPSIVI